MFVFSVIIVKEGRAVHFKFVIEIQKPAKKKRVVSGVHLVDAESVKDCVITKKMVISLVVQLDPEETKNFIIEVF